MTRFDEFEKPDGIRELEEWQDHRYSPGYWVNRVSIFFPQKRSEGNRALALVDLVLYIPGLLFTAFIYVFVDRDPGYLPLLVVLSVGCLLSILRVKSLSPEKRPRRARETKESTSNKHKKKKLPKRRKDWQ